jgi:DNA primase
VNHIASALARKLGLPERQGKYEYNYECPRPGCKQDGKKKFGVNLRRGHYHCFRCHSGGFVRDLLEELHIDLSISVTTVREEVLPEVETPVFIPGFVPFGLNDGGSGVIIDDIIRMCWMKAKIDLPELVKLGWGYSDETWLSYRLIVPVYLDGVLVQYLARSANGLVEPKEKSGPEKQGWWPKEKVAYGIDGLAQNQDVVLVEGVWDWRVVSRTITAGRVAASLGTSLGGWALGSLLRKRPRSVTLFYDSDPAGRRATERVARDLRGRGVSQVYDAQVRNGPDPKALSDTEILKLLWHRRRLF